MKLEWFREHSSKFFWITAILVIPGMILFGAWDPFNRNKAGRRGSATELFHLDGSREWYSPEEMLKSRANMYQFSEGRYPVGTKEVLQGRARYVIARDAGFEVGPEEMTELLRRDIKQRTQKENVTPDLHNLVLENLKLTGEAYEQIIHEYAVPAKYDRLLYQAQVIDNELFIDYCKDKQTARLWYKAIRGKDYEAEVEKPKQEAVKKYYGEHKDDKSHEPESLFKKASLDAHLLYHATKDVEHSTSPDEEEAKAHYEQHKRELWKKAGAAGPAKPKEEGAQPAAQAEEYLPFEQVKEEVAKHWLEEELKLHYDRLKPSKWVKEKKAEPKDGGKDSKEPKAGEPEYKPFAEVREEVLKEFEKFRKLGVSSVLFRKFKKFGTELREKIDAREKEGKKFSDEDWKAFAAERKLTWWKSDRHTQDEFRKGGSTVGDKDFDRLQFAFGMAPTYFPKQEAGKPSPQAKRPQLESPVMVNALQEGEGYVAYMINSYEEERLMTEEEAGPVIERRLVENAASEKAKAAAEELRKSWRKDPKNIPAQKDLNDESFSGDSPGINALAQSFFNEPVALGEVLEVAAEPDPEFKDDRGSGRKRFLVGFAVERKVPNREAFEKDLAWKPSSRRQSLVYDRIHFNTQRGRDYLSRLGKPHTLTKEPDPPIFAQ